MKPRTLSGGGGNDEILRLILLKHHPLHFDVIASMAPVAQRVEIAHVEQTSSPASTLAKPRVILRVTNVSRRGLSWLNSNPLQAYIP